MKRTIGVAGAVLLFALLACKNKTDGTISVNGAAFPVDSCRSGQANLPPFTGVDFLDKTGRRARFLLQDNGQIRVFMFPAGAKQGELVGEECGTLAIEQQNSEVNGVKNVKGSVNANCTGAGYTVAAAINFSNCH